MKNDKHTLMDTIEQLRTYHKSNPDCFTRSDLHELEALGRYVNQLLGAAHRNQLNDERLHRAFDNAHALRKKLERKCKDYACQKKWQEEYLRREEEKFNPYHKPAGPGGGQFDNAPGGSSSDGGSGSGSGSPRAGDILNERVMHPHPLERIGTVASNSRDVPVSKVPSPTAVGQRLRKPNPYPMTPHPARKLTASPKGVAYIAEKEEFRSQVYSVRKHDGSPGKPTIGYGHELLDGESFPNGVSHEEAQKLLNKDVAIAEAAVHRNVKVPLTQPQFDALTSLTFNIGSGNFADSTVLKELNNGNQQAAADAFTLWPNKTRRKEEAEEFRRGIH